MLISFTAENFLSFKEETEFNMLTGDIRRLPHHVFKYPKIDLLKSAVIYGANGAGKSNLAIAIDRLQDFVRQGAAHYNSENKFKLGKSANKPMKFEIEFIENRVGYSYGVSVEENLIHEEWLYKLGFGAKEDEMIFERTTTKSGRTKINLHQKYRRTEKMKMFIEIYEEDVAEKDVSLLHLFKDKPFKEIREAYNWFDTKCLVIFPRSEFFGLANRFGRDEDFTSFTNELLNNLKTGVDRLDVMKLDINTYFGEDNIQERENVLKDVMNGEEVRIGSGNMSALALLEDGRPIVRKIVSVHKDLQNKDVKFELHEESDGTIRLLDLIPALYATLKYPITVIIDEIDQSIHPVLLMQVMERFQHYPSRTGQIIITTHESNLLDQDLYRQDEIWFCEKDKDGASHFYPLSDFNIRQDLDIRKGYLTGRFGAIPFLNNLEALNWDTCGEKK